MAAGDGSDRVPRAPAPDEPTPAAAYAEDLALARACQAGDPAAWERFAATYRPVLARAARALDPGGGADELAEGLLAELFGVTGRGNARRSLLSYYQGRSRLATWLRAVLAQRHVDAIRARRRFEPLVEDERRGPAEGRSAEPDPDRDRYLAAMREALGRAIGALAPRDRLRVACYYGDGMRLSAIGAMLGEHEASVSRHLTRARAEIRAAVMAWLRSGQGMDAREAGECVRALVADPGTLDLSALFEAAGPARPGPRKALLPDRSR
jgi:RNA polymerase sigma factor (sigma-70 family)